MALNVKDCKGECWQTIQAGGWNSRDIKDMIENIADKRGVPVSVRTDEIKSGGLLSSNFFPCVIVSHPNPPQSYFDQIIIINGNIINFQFWGMSKANYSANMKEYHKSQGSLSGLVKSAFYQNDQMALQTEQFWHQHITDIYAEIWFGSSEE